MGLDDKKLNRWQEKLLPLMSGMVIGLAFFFFLASCLQLYLLNKRIWASPKLKNEKAFSLETDPSLSAQEKLNKLKFNSLLKLEANLLERRYHQANVSLMARVWIRYLGFVTGMILALVGAVFILGKLQGSVSELDVKAYKADFSLKSASPGLFLAGLGVTLMLITIVTHHEIKVADGAVYTQSWNTQSREFSESQKNEKLQPALKMPKTQPSVHPRQ